MEKKNLKNVLIGALLVIIALMAIGYAALATTLTINGTANITSHWEVLFTDMKKVEVGGGKDVSSSYDATSAVFDVELVSPGDYVEYTITVENKGTLDAVLSSYTATNIDGTEAIIYTLSGVNQNDVLLAGATQDVVVRVTYNPAVTTQPTTDELSKTITVILNYTQNK